MKNTLLILALFIFNISSSVANTDSSWILNLRVERILSMIKGNMILVRFTNDFKIDQYQAGTNCRLLPYDGGGKYHGAFRIGSVPDFFKLLLTALHTKNLVNIKFSSACEMVGREFWSHNDQPPLGFKAGTNILIIKAVLLHSE